MGYHDQFEDADVLDTLSWMGMPEAHRIMKTAALFLQRESEIRREHRNWDGPTISNVRPFVKSYYTPPRGRGKATIEMTLKAIEYQRRIRSERKANRPYKPETPANRNSEHGIRTRKNAVAERYYTVYERDWDDRKVRASHNCVAIGTIAGIRLLVDAGGGYGRRSALPRIYMEEKATGRVKIVVLEPNNSIKSLADALLWIAPKGPMRSMFGGETLTLRFDERAFEWRGQLVPWRNVRKIYGKAKAHNMVGRPKKKQ
jgi:hypothetical protein